MPGSSLSPTNPTDLSPSRRKRKRSRRRHRSPNGGNRHAAPPRNPSIWFSIAHSYSRLSMTTPASSFSPGSYGTPIKQSCKLSFVLVLVVVLPTSPTSRLWSAPRLRGRLRAVGNIEHGLRRTGCPRIRPRGVMECGSVGVLRQVRKAPA